MSPGARAGFARRAAVRRAYACWRTTASLKRSSINVEEVCSLTAQLKVAEDRTQPNVLTTYNVSIRVWRAVVKKTGNCGELIADDALLPPDAYLIDADDLEAMNRSSELGLVKPVQGLGQGVVTSRRPTH